MAAGAENSARLGGNRLAAVDGWCGATVVVAGGRRQAMVGAHRARTGREVGVAGAGHACAMREEKGKAEAGGLTGVVGVRAVVVGEEVGDDVPAGRRSGKGAL